MAKKVKEKSQLPSTPREHIGQLVEWMSQNVYEKEQIIAVALLCAVAGENMFLLGPPGTAKSMVASRLKMVFKDGKSFDYLMSRFSTPDEIFGPVSISRLKNDDRYERLTAGYLPDADVVFLDEIWKAGPSIQNTLLTVINEHVFHNGGQVVQTPMKVLIAASNELPAKDEGLEALWDRFLVRMVSNCIEGDAAFFKMMKSSGKELKVLPDSLFITEELYGSWQDASKEVGIHDSVVCAIKAVRKRLAVLEKEDGNQLRYYISDRRWRKAYRLMQTSAYLNGRGEINLTDYLLLIHSFWNDVECIPAVLEAFTSSMSDVVVKCINKIDKSISLLMSQEKQVARQTLPAGGGADYTDFIVYDYFYYCIENYPSGETYFYKWDYSILTDTPCDGIRYFDFKRQKFIIHSVVPDRPFEVKSQYMSNLTKIKICKCSNGVVIDGVPYAFRCNRAPRDRSSEILQNSPGCQQVVAVQEMYKNCVDEWEQTVASNWTDCDNLFLSSADLALVNRMLKEVGELIKTTGVKLSNVAMMMQ